ncbi:hypothetical protein BGZ47_008371 [Haplosporangium gracile]|nr:hypothetical protein BGZ47_008371 [Haplosporangium gracile]
MASNSSSFRATQWDPVLILSQIACLQAIWYISISTIVYILFRFSGIDITLDAILNYREIRADTAEGMLLGLAWLINSLIGVYLLLKIVSRARLVLDYSLTLVLYHVLMVTMYSNHVPSTFLWWALNGTTCGIMIFGGEYVCMQQEMEPIILGGSGGSQSNNNNNNNTSSGNSNNNNNNNNSGSVGSTSGALASQGASLSGMHDGHGNYEESAGLLMETLDHSNNSELSNHMSLSGASRTMPTKARSSEDTSGFRGSSGFSPAIRSSILGNQNHGRQRTSDRYETVPTTDSDNC